MVSNDDGGGGLVRGFGSVIERGGGSDAVFECLRLYAGGLSCSDVAKRLNECDDFSFPKKVSDGMVWRLVDKYRGVIRERREEEGLAVEKAFQLDMEINSTLDEIQEQLEAVKLSDEKEVTKANTVMSILKERMDAVRTAMKLHGINNRGSNKPQVAVQVVNNISEDKKDLREEILRGDFHEEKSVEGGVVVEDEETD